MYLKVTINVPVLYHYRVESISIWTVTDFRKLPLNKTMVDLKSNNTVVIEVSTFQAV